MTSKGQIALPISVLSSSPSFFVSLEVGNLHTWRSHESILDGCSFEFCFSFCFSHNIFFPLYLCRPLRPMSKFCKPLHCMDQHPWRMGELLGLGVSEAHPSQPRRNQWPRFPMWLPLSLWELFMPLCHSYLPRRIFSTACVVC